MTEIDQNLPEFAEIGRNWPEFTELNLTRICQNLPKLLEIGVKKKRIRQLRRGRLSPPTKRRTNSSITPRTTPPPTKRRMCDHLPRPNHIRFAKGRRGRLCTWSERVHVNNGASIWNVFNCALPDRVSGKIVGRNSDKLVTRRAD